MRKYVLFSCIFSEEYHFCLCSVGCESIKIASSGDPSFTLSSLISSRNKCNLASIIDSSVSEINNNKPRDESSDPFICFNFDEIINPITVVHVTESFIFHRTICTDESLQRIGKIVVVTEIKVLAGKHILKALYVDFIF
jgi:hypothetical protein